MGKSIIRKNPFQGRCRRQRANVPVRWVCLAALLFCSILSIATGNGGGINPPTSPRQSAAQKTFAEQIEEEAHKMAVKAKEVPSENDVPPKGGIADAKKCKVPPIRPRKTTRPQQVHLALTKQPDEMRITWVTFPDKDLLERHGDAGVYTYVDYWKYGDHERHTMKSLKADRIHHEYSDQLKLLECSLKDMEMKGWNRIVENARYIHTATLKGLEENTRYEYEVGHCVPSFTEDGMPCVCIPVDDHQIPCEKVPRRRDVNFNFHVFARNRWMKLTGNGGGGGNDDVDDFTIVVFGDMGLQHKDIYKELKPPKTKVKKRSIEASPKRKEVKEKVLRYKKLDILASSMESLFAMVHAEHTPEMYPNREHPVLKSHLDANSSGLQMRNAEIIMHIGDIAYDMNEWQLMKIGEETYVYNIGDRFMDIIEDVAAFVPYMVLAGNHENEEKTSTRPDINPGSHFNPQYEHYESRFKMPESYDGHNTNQYYHFTYGPIWFICVSTEFYYSYAIKKPKYRWVSDVKRVAEQYDFIEYSLMLANKYRKKYPWIVIVQHRPFYCTSTNKITCKFNKLHKDGIKDPNNKERRMYGLEELYNKYHVDLVITGHEHIFELFPPIQLHQQKNKVIPYKYWWQAKRTVKHADALAADGVTRTTAVVQHDFLAYTDPIAPTYVIVGRPGNAEQTEVLTRVPHLQRIKQYKPFSYTLLHYPGKRAKKSLIAVRQVDVAKGNVPLEFVIEKRFITYEKENICVAIDRMEHNRQSNYALAESDIIMTRRPYTEKEKPLAELRKPLKDPEEFSIFMLEKLMKNDEQQQQQNGNSGRRSRNGLGLNEGTLLEEMKQNIVADPNSFREIREEMLLAEIGPRASPNSKIRALLYEFNFHRDKQLYRNVKEQICGHILTFRPAMAKPRLAFEGEDPMEQEQNIFVQYGKNTRMRELMAKFETAENVACTLNNPTIGNYKHTHNELCQIQQQTPVKKQTKWQVDIPYLNGKNNYGRHKQAGNTSPHPENIHTGFGTQIGAPKVPVAVSTAAVGSAIAQKTRNRMTPGKSIMPSRRELPVFWSQSELRDLTNLLAFFYLRGFLAGTCKNENGWPKFLLFKGIQQKGLDGKWVLPSRLFINLDVLEKLVDGKLPDDTSNCFYIDYPTPAEVEGLPKYGDRDPSSDGPKYNYHVLLYQLFEAKKIKIAKYKIAYFAGKNGLPQPRLLVHPAIVLKTIQKRAVEPESFFKRSIKSMVVDDPMLIANLRNSILYKAVFQPKLNNQQ